ncbi:MAG: hypothetical protein ACHQM6_07720 [Candidatus Kapaibacterium sp.]
MKIPHIASLFLTLIFAGFLISPESAFSQRASSKNNDIAVDFIDYLVNNTFSGQYEFKSTSTSSFFVRAEYVTKNTGDASGITSAFGVGVGWRFYILDSRALSGFSIAPAVDLFFFKNSTLSRNNIVFSLGADAAYKFFFDQFTVEPTLGIRNGFVPSNAPPPGENTFSGIYPVVAIYLGYAW